MSTDLHNRTRQPDPDQGPDKPESPKSSLSIAQVVGGALAAMTAAALGSRLSLAGTVLGAAIASIVAAVAGSIYTASLRRTSRHVNAVLTRVRPGSTGSGPTQPDSPPATSPLSDTTVAEPGTGWVLPDEQPATGTPGSAPQARRARIGWKQVLVGALLMFVIAALVLTGIELVTGRALSGGGGTTVGQVADPGTRPSAEPTKRPSATPTATSSPTASAEPSTTSSATPSSEPTAAPSTTQTAAPSPTPTASPTPTPTGSASPSGLAATP